MKTFTKLLSGPAFLLALLTIILSSCEDKVEITRTYTVYEPVYMSLTELRESVDVIEPQILEQTGKLYLYQDYILINDPGQGINIVDNTDQSNPTPVKYINLPGTSDFSVRGDILYADSYMDLVMLDISDLDNISEINRVEDIFVEFIVDNGFYLDPDSGLVVDYVEKEIIEVTEKDVAGNYYKDIWLYSSGDRMENSLAGFANSDASYVGVPSGSPVGIGGSMATFTIVNSHLYILDNQNLLTFDITNPDNVMNVDILTLGWGIETIFPYQSNIFVGSQNGMYIVDNTDQNNPELISMYQHIVSCDPVVVQGDKAYVTLRGGTDCRGNNQNLLEVIDISNLEQPTLIASHEMISPFGLGIDGNALFVCEGEHGLKVFNAENDFQIRNNMILQISNIDAFDVIPFQNTLYLIGKDGLYQYDYSSLDDITMISKLSVDNSNVEL